MKNNLQYVSHFSFIFLLATPTWPESFFRILFTRSLDFVLGIGTIGHGQ
jgi:hypothetical protein